MSIDDTHANWCACIRTPPPASCQGPQADLQQQRPQMVFVNDPLTSGGHVRLLDVVIAASAFSCG